MEAVAHRPLQGSIQTALNAAQAPAPRTLHECGRRGGQQSQQQRPCRGAPHQEHAGQIERDRQQRLPHAHGLIQSQGAAIDIRHQQGQQVTTSELVQLRR